MSAEQVNNFIYFSMITKWEYPVVDEKTIPLLRLPAHPFLQYHPTKLLSIYCFISHLLSNLLPCLVLFSATRNKSLTLGELLVLEDEMTRCFILWGQAGHSQILLTAVSCLSHCHCHACTLLICRSCSLVLFHLDQIWVNWASGLLKLLLEQSKLEMYTRAPSLPKTKNNNGNLV